MIKPTLSNILRGALTHTLEDTLTNDTKSYILTKRIVLLPLDWDKNSSLFTKQLLMMNKIIG